MSIAWGGSESTADICIAAYHSFLQTRCAQDCIPNFHRDLLLAQQHLSDEDIEVDDQPQLPEQQDEWMLLCQLHPHFNVPQNPDNHTDWSAPARDLPTDLIRECPKWI